MIISLIQKCSKEEIRTTVSIYVLSKIPESHLRSPYLCSFVYLYLIIADNSNQKFSKQSQLRRSRGTKTEGIKMSESEETSPEFVINRASLGSYSVHSLAHAQPYNNFFKFSVIVWCSFL